VVATAAVDALRNSRRLLRDRLMRGSLWFVKKDHQAC